jgi:hypothetical protein
MSNNLSNNQNISKSSYEYLNEQVKPLFIPIISKAIKQKPEKNVRFLFS